MAGRDAADLEELQRLLQRLDQELAQSPAKAAQARGVAARSGVTRQSPKAVAPRTIPVAGALGVVASVGIIALLFLAVRGHGFIGFQATSKQGAPSQPPMPGGQRLALIADTAALQLETALPLRAQPAIARSVTEASGAGEVATSALAVPEAATDHSIDAASPDLKPDTGMQAEPGASALDQLDASQLLQRGLVMLSRGNVRAAQLLLERAADLGSGEAAFALATTYDGAPGAPRPGSEVRPNADQALRWYARARELGAKDAGKRLTELGSR